MNDPNKIAGVWCRSDDTFYYLDTGIHSVRNPQQRVLSMLTAQDKIEFDKRGTQRFQEPYKLMTLAEARNKKYVIKSFALNQHVGQAVLESEKTTHSGWK